MKHYLFVEEISGEQFIVGAATFGEAQYIAQGICQDIGEEYHDEYHMVFLDELTEEEAEMSGLDEY